MKNISWKTTVAFLLMAAGALAYGIVLGVGPAPSVYAQQGNRVGQSDPCANFSVLKSSAAITMASATTTQLVAPITGTIVYICDVSITIAPSATSADTAKFITGTGATCGGSTVTNTGTFGAGDLTSAAPVVAVNIEGPGMIFSSAASSGLCIVTTGTAVSVQGIVTFIQQ